MAQDANIIIGLRSQNVLEDIQHYGDYVVPTFADADINAVFANYTIYSMEQTYPASRFPHMHRYYTLKSNNLNLISDLQNLNNPNIPYSEIAPQGVLTYTPNDYGTNCNGNARDLDLIRAEQAWDITKGDPNIVIGVTDTRYDLTHNDFQGKIDTVRSNTNFGGYHGQIVASIIGAKTDNSIGISSIGFNCKLDLSTMWANNNEMLEISRYGRRILNGSWGFGDCSFHNSVQAIYDEIYENGTIACFGAGNGYQHCNFGYMYPAAYDHNI